MKSLFGSPFCRHSDKALRPECRHYLFHVIGIPFLWLAYILKSRTSSSLHIQEGWYCEHTENTPSKKSIFLWPYFPEILPHYGWLHTTSFCHGRILVPSRHPLRGRCRNRRHSKPCVQYPYKYRAVVSQLCFPSLYSLLSWQRQCIRDHICNYRNIRVR